MAKESLPAAPIASGKRVHNARKLLEDSAEKAAKTLVDLLSREHLTQSERSLADVAKTILDRVGLSAVPSKAPEAAGKTLAEMSRDELEEQRRALDRLISDRAVLVIDAQVSAQRPSQDLDDIEF